MFNLNRFIITLFLTFLFSSSISAQVDDTLSDRLQMSLDYQRKLHHMHGISAACIFSDNASWIAVSGMSDPVSGQVMEPDLYFWTSSITKMFTGALTLKLNEDGLLNLQDSLDHWLPSFPHIDSTITIRQLLNHTSGIYHWSDHDSVLPAVAADPNRYWTPEEILLSFVKEAPFSPGETVYYSATDYTLLGMIIEQATDSSLHILKKNHLDPQSMLKNTCFQWSDTLTENFAHPWRDIPPGDGHVDDVLQYFRTAAWSLSFGTGNIISTPEDIAIWTKNLFEGNIISKSSLDEMLQGKPVPWPPKTSVGLGVMSFELSGKEYWGHGGRTSGYTNLSLYSLSDSLSLTLFINDHDAPRYDVAEALFNVISTYINQEPNPIFDENEIDGLFFPQYGSPFDTTVHIYNHGFTADSIYTSLYFSSADSEAIQLEPSTFELAPGDSQAINISIYPSLLGTGSFFTRLIVDSRFGPFKTHWEKPINFAVLTNLEERVINLPLDFCLFQNYPNPFNPLTMINYQIPARSVGGPMINDVDLSIYNIRGQKVATLVNKRQQAGSYQIKWDASGLASGVYYYKIQAGEFVDVKKMILIR